MKANEEEDTCQGIEEEDTCHMSEVDPQDYLGGVTVFEMGLSLPWHEPVLAKAVRTGYQRSVIIKHKH